MRIILTDTTNPYFNLATEEYLLKKMKGDFFMLWRNSPAIIVGRNQNTHAEINIEYVAKHDIPVVRRLTGGGAVFHDLGNINYTFIEDNGTDKFGDYEVFSRPIVEVLRSLGVNAGLKGRNDLLIDDRKFSGNAQVAWRNRVMHHGTLMFSANVSHMTEALNVNELKIKSKGIKSVRSRVTNISEHLKNPLTIDEFCKMVAEKILNSRADCELYTLNTDDIKEINELVNTKYSTWEWNFGFKKEFSFSKQTLLPCGILEVNLNIIEDKIKDARIQGDYFGLIDVSEFESMLTGTPYDPVSLKNKFDSINISDYFSGLTSDELLSAFI